MSPLQTARPGGKSPLRVKPKSRSWHHLTPQEFADLLTVVSNVRHRAAYWLMYGCGMRAGEVYNMTAANIDLRNRRGHVVNRAATEKLPPFTVKAEGQSTETKERSVPIPEAAVPT